MMANVNKVMQLTTSAFTALIDTYQNEVCLWDTTKNAAEDKELSWSRISVLFGIPVGNMCYTVLAYFYMDCQIKVNAAICIAAYYGKNVAKRCLKMAR